MDEPASALDPESTARIEDLIFELKRDITIVIVTHNMQQAARVSDLTAFFYLGRLIESGTTEQIFTRRAASRRKTTSRDDLAETRSVETSGTRSGEPAARCARHGCIGRGDHPQSDSRLQERDAKLAESVIDSDGSIDEPRTRSRKSASRFWRCISRWRSTCGASRPS